MLVEVFKTGQCLFGLLHTTRNLMNERNGGNVLIVQFLCDLVQQHSELMGNVFVYGGTAVQQDARCSSSVLHGYWLIAAELRPCMGLIAAKLCPRVRLIAAELCPSVRLIEEINL